MATKTEICNQALSEVGGKLVADIDTATSKEAEYCNLHYDNAVATVMEAHCWTFATKKTTLTASATPDGFGDASLFAKPVDALRIWRVFFDSDYRNALDAEDWTVEGENIVAYVETIYVKYIINAALDTWSSLMDRAVILELASRLAVPVAANMKLKLSLQSQAMDAVNTASSIDGGQGRREKLKNGRLTSVRRR